MSMRNIKLSRLYDTLQQADYGDSKVLHDVLFDVIEELKEINSELESLDKGLEKIEKKVVNYNLG